MSIKTNELVQGVDDLPISLDIFNWYKQDVVGHSLRTALLARALASELHLGEQEVSLVGLAGLVHDIGKIAIPVTLLDKPGPLTKQEWVLMRLHSQIGARMLQSVGGIWSCIAPLVLAHHERWDGQGYPYGLAGEAIPHGSRILAVVDAYDAMTESRPYKLACTSSEAQAEVLRYAGSAYDPEIAAAFVRLLERDLLSQVLC